jgi:hypothetical protein
VRTAPAFGDAEPEDAWDVGDAPAELVSNLERRVAVLGEPARASRGGELADRFGELELAVERLRARRAELDDRALRRAELVVVGLELVRTRLEAG